MLGSRVSSIIEASSGYIGNGDGWECRFIFFDDSSVHLVNSKPTTALGVSRQVLTIIPYPKRYHSGNIIWDFMYVVVILCTLKTQEI